MKTYRKILDQKEDGAIAVDVFNRGFPEYMYAIEGGADVSFARIFLNLMRLEGEIVSNGFHGIFDQLIPPWELAEHEKILEVIGAGDFLKYFRKCKEIYFGSRVPNNQNEWDEMGRSIIHVNPNGFEGIEFDKNAELAEDAFYGFGRDPIDYIDLHKKLGRFLRQNLASMLRSDDLDL